MTKCAFFNTKDSELYSRNGEIVDIVRPLTKNECDINDVGMMYRVKFHDDNLEVDAFEDELASAIFVVSLYRTNEDEDPYLVTGFEDWFDADEYYEQNLRTHDKMSFETIPMCKKGETIPYTKVWSEQ